MGFLFLEPWHDFLPTEGGHVISLMGSGGKTSLLRALGRHYADCGVPTVLTTTTRSEPLAELPVVDWPVGTTLPKDLPEQVYLRGGVDEAGKWLGLLPEQADDLVVLLPDRVVVAEVDGAAKHVVKLHRDDEPLWPLQTSLAVVVMGMSALGEPIGQVVHRWGTQDAGPLAELSADQDWDWTCYERLLTGPGGYLDRVPAGVPVLLALLGMGEVDDSIGLFEFLGRVTCDERLPLIMMGDTAGETARLRTVYRVDEDPATEPSA